MSALTLSKQLLNSRTRVYHSGASTWVSGWLYDVEMPDLWISVATPLPKGASVTLAVQTEKSSIHFMARIEEADRDEDKHRKTAIFLGNGLTVAQPEQYCYHLALTSAIRQLPNQQSDRKAVSDFQVRLTSEFDDIPARVWDISKGGACIHTFSPPDPDTSYQIVCEVEGRDIVLPSSLRHSRKIPAGDPLFATGVMLEGCSRVDAARWAARYQQAVVTPSRMSKNAGTPLIQIPVEMPEESTGPDYMQEISDILEKMRRAGLTERSIVQTHLREVDVQNGDRLVADLEKRLESIVKFEQDLEKSLLETVRKLYCTPGRAA